MKTKRPSSQGSSRTQAVIDKRFYTVCWRIDGLAYGPIFEASLDAAMSKRDKILKDNDKPIPKDYYERQARIIAIDVYVEQYSQGSWSTLKESTVKGVWDIRFVD